MTSHQPRHQRISQYVPPTPRAICRTVTNDNGLDPSPPPTRRAAGGTERATLQLTGSIIRLEVSGDIDPQRAAECLRLCLRLFAKITRVESGVTANISASDALTTLVQIELTLTQLRSTLGPLHDPRARAALAELDRLLAPLVGTYDAVRHHLSRLTREVPASVATAEQATTPV